jgi:hypothetical protein
VIILSRMGSTPVFPRADQKRFSAASPLTADRSFTDGLYGVVTEKKTTKQGLPVLVVSIPPELATKHGFGPVATVAVSMHRFGLIKIGQNVPLKPDPQPAYAIPLILFDLPLWPRQTIPALDMDKLLGIQSHSPVSF